jgi:hypothetical protein
MPDKDFWNSRYVENNTGWDLGLVSPPLVWMVSAGWLPPGSRVLIPGAGRCYEGIYLAGLGYSVTAVDFAPEAAREARENAEKNGVSLSVLEQDLFLMDPKVTGTFDILFEQTCFCAIDPERRVHYKEMAERMIRKGGELLGLFYAHGREGGPPWTTTEEEVRALFGESFDFSECAITPHSVDSRKGEELMVRLIRR